MVLGEGPNWSRRVLSKKFKICDPPFYECHQIPNFDSIVLLTTEFQTKRDVSPGSPVIIVVEFFLVVVFFGRGSQTRYPERDKMEFTTSS